MDLLNQKLFGGAVLELLFCCLENVLQVEKMELGVFVVSKRRELCSEGDSSLCPRRCKSAPGRVSLPADTTGEVQREEPRPESHF